MRGGGGGGEWRKGRERGRVGEGLVQKIEVLSSKAQTG